jgi:hypothetical protein
MVYPTPNIFPIPDACGNELRAELVAAFTLFWCDRGARIGKIRNAVEVMLTDLGVPRFHRKNGKRQRLSLHARVERLKAKQSDLARSLFALKWLGNAGSHPDRMIMKDDAMDGFEILEHAIHEHYGKPHRQRITRLGSAIIRKKGPRSKS